MSSNKTDRLALHSWEPEDMFTREEFNENFRIIDANLGKGLVDVAAVQEAAAEAALAAAKAQSAADTAMAAARTAQGTADGRLRFCCGQYTGEMKDAAASFTKTLTFDFPPRIVWLSTAYTYSDSSGPYEVIPGGSNNSFPPFLLFTREMKHLYVYPPGGNIRVINLTWSGNTLTFTVTRINASDSTIGPDCSLNKNGIVYHWFAIG